MGVPGRRGCQRCPGMVKASTLMDMVLAGMRLKRFWSELYLKMASTMGRGTVRGPTPARRLSAGGSPPSV